MIFQDPCRKSKIFLDSWQEVQEFPGSQVLENMSDEYRSLRRMTEKCRQWFFESSNDRLIYLIGKVSPLNSSVKTQLNIKMHLLYKNTQVHHLNSLLRLMYIPSRAREKAHNKILSRMFRAKTCTVVRMSSIQGYLSKCALLPKKRI